MAGSKDSGKRKCAYAHDRGVTLTDEQIPEVAKMYADAFRKQAAEQGYVDLFGIQIGEPSFERLQELIDRKFNMPNRAKKVKNNEEDVI